MNHIKEKKKITFLHMKGLYIFIKAEGVSDMIVAKENLCSWYKRGYLQKQSLFLKTDCGSTLTLTWMNKGMPDFFVVVVDYFLFVCVFIY